MKNNIYTLYWRTGDRETVSGTDPATAMTMAGYGGGSLGALDFFARGDNKEYTWNSEKREWIKESK